MDPDIFNQMKIASKLVGLLGFQFINNPLYEADDILGMIAHWGMDHDMDTVIISSDRDLYQLVSTHTYIMSPRNNDLIDLNYMHDMYQLTPSQWIDLKILQGDQSDNIIGVRGIGNKTATQLMLEYGSVDNIYNHLSELKPNVRDNLVNGRNNIPITRTLVTIVTDYSKINLEEAMLYRKAPFTTAIYAYLNEIELPSLMAPMKYSLLPQLNDRIEIHDQAQIPSNN
jgi:DNA polymerase-1